MNNPQIKSFEDIVPAFNYSIKEVIKLSRDIKPLDRRFDAVISVRKSTRLFRQLKLAQIGDILSYVAKVQDTYQQDNGYILTHRATASAGARHPVDIIINTPVLSKGDFYYYNPFEHSLNNLKEFEGSNLTRHVNNIVDTTNATIIWFVAHKYRTQAKYSNADSLVWRDAGALINGIQMVCGAMGLNSCPIGSLGEPFISDYFNNQEGIVGAGGLLIG
ncbi:MAG TPA: nitroreductase family protein [Pedobacter sp.]|jgi:SagB-type dehydrogenase family enzyme